MKHILFLPKNQAAMRKWSDAHFFFDLFEAFYCEIEVFFCVTCGNLRADPRFAHGNNGIAEADNVNSLFKHAPCKFLCYLCIIEHDGNDGMSAFGNIETKFTELLTEITCVLVNLVAECSGFVQHIEYLDGCCANCG